MRRASPTLVPLLLAAACGGNSAADSSDADNDDGIDAQVGPDADPNAPDADPNAFDAMVTPDAAPPTGDPVWLRRGGSTLADGATAVAVGQDGSVYVGGTFQGSADFGDGFLVSRGDTDLYVVKYAADGEIAWSRSFGGCSGDELTGLALDDDDGVIVVGNVNYANQNAPCDPFFNGARIPAGFAAGPYGALAVMARYDAAGDEQVARAYGPPASTTRFAGVAYDAGRIAVVGYHNNGVSFGAGLALPADGFDGLVALLTSSDGDGVWARSLTGPNVSTDFTAVTLDGDHATIAGHFDGTVSVGAPQSLIPAGLDDVVIASYARADGAYAWHRQLGGVSSDWATSIAHGPDGATWTAASFVGTSYFGDGPFVSIGRDGAIARFDAAGEHLASAATGAAAEDEWRAIAAYADGGAAVVGVNTTVEVGVTRRVNAAGEALWTHVFESTDAVTPTAVALAPDGSVLVVGRFTGTLTIGDLPTVTSAGLNDSFVVRLAP